MTLRTVVFILIVLLVLSITVGVSIGAVSIAISDVWQIAGYKIGLLQQGTWSSATENIVWLIRFPRVFLAALVGGVLAVTGATLQTMVRNPLADPYILGISAGASVGAVLAIGLGLFAFLGTLAVSLAAFLGAAVTFLVVLFLSSVGGTVAPGRLVMAGLGMGYFLSGITGLITLTSSNRLLAGEILSWTLGSLARATWFDLTLPAFLLSTVTAVLLIQARKLNALLLGDETAATLGLNVSALRRQLFILVALLIGITVAVSGSIGFIGLMVPHIVRIFVRSDHRRILPVSAILGGILLVWTDILSRIVFAPSELPVGVVTAIVGGPFFLWIIFRNHTTDYRDLH
ncbi:MAG: iron ABC transporter permease [Chloroflexi bacterium]|nr:iron ABC transporter permease [Chloroflexota bacterium]